MKNNGTTFNARIFTRSTTCFPTRETKTTAGLTIPLGTTRLQKEQSDAIRKEPDEEMDENNQKKLQKIVGNLLYYARCINHTMLMALNSLEVVQTNPKIRNARKKIIF